MTVGQPETNLDTWGLRYVKKKSPTENIEGSTERGERKRVEAHSSGSSPKNITTGIGISDADVATPDSPKHITGTQGSDKRRTYGADRKERNQQYDIPPTKDYISDLDWEKLNTSNLSSNLITDLPDPCIIQYCSLWLWAAVRYMWSPFLRVVQYRFVMCSLFVC